MYVFASFTAIGLLMSLSLRRGGDFGSLIASGLAARQGLDPYAIHPLVGRAVLGSDALAFVNLNAPLSVLLFAAVSLIPASDAYDAWLVLSALLYLAVLVVLTGANRTTMGTPKLAWALSLPGLWVTLEQGQIYVVLLFVAVGAWLSLDRGHLVRAGLLMGLLVAIKPQFAVWPGLLLLAGHTSVAAAAAGSASALAILPAVVFGPGIYAQWLVAVGSIRWLGALSNGSLPDFGARLGLPWLGYGLSAALLAGIAVRVWRTRPSAPTASALALTTFLLAAPLAGPGYMLVLLPALCSRPWTGLLGVGATLLAVPVYALPILTRLSAWQFAAGGSVYTLALLLLLAALLHSMQAHHNV